MRTRFIFVHTVLLAATVAQAQDTPHSPPAPIVISSPADEPEVSLDELIGRARQNNPRLSIARENLAASREHLLALRAVPSPTLQLVPGITGSREARDEEVILAQPLDVFGLRRARAGVAAANLRRAEADSTVADLALVIDVRNAVTALFAAQEAESLEQAQVEIAQVFRDAAARRAQLGDAPLIQVQRADLELLRAQNDLSGAHAERLSRRVLLNLLTGQKPDAPLRVTLPLDAADLGLLHAPVAAPLEAPAVVSPQSVPPPSASGTSVTGRGELASRPDIVGAQANLEARRAESQALRRESLPTVELQARRSAFFGNDGSYALRAVVNVPLFDFGALKGERRAAQAQARAQEAALVLLRQQAAAQVETARVRLEQHRQNVVRYREQLVPLSLDLLRKTQIGYAQGASTYLEVLEAQRMLRQVQSEYLQAIVNVQGGQTALDAARFGGMPQRESRLEILDDSAVRGAAQ